MLGILWLDNLLLSSHDASDHLERHLHNPWQVLLLGILTDEAAGWASLNLVAISSDDDSLVLVLF